MKINIDRARAAIASRGMTQKAIAERAGMNPSRVSEILSRGSCDPRNAAKIAEAIGIDIEYLLQA